MLPIQHPLLSLLLLCVQTLQPLELARIVHQLFSEFDKAVKEYHLFKV